MPRKAGSGTKGAPDKISATSRAAPAPAPAPASNGNIVEATAARPHPRTNATPRMIPQQIILPLLFLLVPFVQMLWTAEAPKRPFSLLKDSAGVATETLIEPRILLVTAHPDDELLCAPTVLSLLNEGKRKESEFYALCLSTGDFGGGEELSKMRKKEWEGSWEVLGLEEERRFILDVPKLKDGNSTWDASAVADQVAPFVLKHDIDTILTFDEEGITGHPNHASLAPGIKHMLSSPSFSKALVKQAKKQKNARIPPRLFTLKSTPWTRQYSVLTPLIEHLVLGARALTLNAEKVKSGEFVLPTVFLSDVKSYGRAWTALRRHQTQLGFKNLALWAWGRYLWINEWVEA